MAATEGNCFPGYVHGPQTRKQAEQALCHGFVNDPTMQHNMLELLAREEGYRRRMAQRFPNLARLVLIYTAGGFSGVQPLTASVFQDIVSGFQTEEVPAV